MTDDTEQCGDVVREMAVEVLNDAANMINFLADLTEDGCYNSEAADEVMIGVEADMSFARAAIEVLEGRDE